MFIIFDINLPKGRISTLTDDPISAFSLAKIIDNSSEVESWKMRYHKPTDFGWAPSSEWNKIKGYLSNVC